jgi:hypothetical protein
MNENRVIALRQKGAIDDPLTEILRVGAAVIDWSSRAVLSWRLSNAMDASFCVAALEEALAKHGKPEIFNIDQSGQFTSADFTGVLSPDQPNAGASDRIGALEGRDARSADRRRRVDHEPGQRTVIRPL